MASRRRLVHRRPVRVADWDRQALERLVRYCARPPLASGRLGRLNEDTLVYRLRRPLLDGRTEILLRPVDLLARLVDLLTPPRKHRHRYCGVLAPAARLRRAVTATAGPAGTVLQALEAAREAMGLAADAPGAGARRRAAGPAAGADLREPPAAVPALRRSDADHRVHPRARGDRADPAAHRGGRPSRPRCCRRGGRRRGSWSSISRPGETSGWRWIRRRGSVTRTEGDQRAG